MLMRINWEWGQRLEIASIETTQQKEENNKTHGNTLPTNVRSSTIIMSEEKVSGHHLFTVNTLLLTPAPILQSIEEPQVDLSKLTPEERLQYERYGIPKKSLATHMLDKRKEVTPSYPIQISSDG